jgi:translation initiation factor 1 (eIF-1/SUI1)
LCSNFPQEAGKKKEKKKGGGAAPLKKAAVFDTKVVMTRVQRQKKKFVTVVAGLETVPDLKIKDAAKIFGKKFSSGCSVNESQTGAKEVVIQGDVIFDLPNILINEFKVSCFYFLVIIVVIVMLTFQFCVAHIFVRSNPPLFLFWKMERLGPTSNTIML